MTDENPAGLDGVQDVSDVMKGLGKTFGRKH